MKRIEKEVFVADETYDDVTPESASQGDFAESGFRHEDMKFSIQDVLDWIDCNGYEHMQFNRESATIYGNSYVSCYQTGTETSEALHIRGPEFWVKLLERIIEKKSK